MKPPRFLPDWSRLCALGLAGLVFNGYAQVVTQTLQLQSGWNAVYLRLQPSPAACDEIFSGLPVTSVFRYNARVLATQFGTDPTQAWKRPDEWLVWVPAGDDSGYIRTLENLLGGAAYLIQTTNACEITLRGQPAIPRFEWVPGQPNLVGFQVGLIPDTRPTFAEFFRYEPAIDGSQRPDTNYIGRIGPGLQVTNLSSRANFEKIDPNLAYWVYAQSRSHYVGPLRVVTSDPAGLLFGRNLNEMVLQIINECDTNPSPVIVTVRHVDSETPPLTAAPSAGPAPLLYADHTATNWVWLPWPTDQSQNWSLTNGQMLTLRLAVNRGALTPPSPANALWQSLLQISSSNTFVQVPISAAYDSGTDQLAAYPYGLWVGEARIREVSSARFDPDAQAEASTAPLPAGGSFPLRLIFHASSDGNYRLLSRALIAALPDANSNIVNRVYTDDAKIPVGATVLTRVSSAAFGRIPPVGLSGPGLLNSLSGAYTVDYDDPLNPFKHVYHPDHNNLGRENAKLPEGEESFTISNRVQLTWDTAPDPGLGATLWRPDETVTGIYEQTISNLRHTPITLRGAFTMKRVSRVGQAQ